MTFLYKKMNTKPYSYYLVIYRPGDPSLTLRNDVFTWITVVLLISILWVGIWLPACSFTPRRNAQIIIRGAEKYSTKGKGYADREKYTNSQLHEKSSLISISAPPPHSAAYYHREDKICFLNTQSQTKFLFLLHNRCYLETQKYINNWKVVVLDTIIQKTWAQVYHCSAWCYAAVISHSSPS